MNGQKIVQSQLPGAADWKVDSVGRAYGIKPGFYHLYSAAPADKQGVTHGAILHIDAKTVFQGDTKTIKAHAREAFVELPEIGALCTIRYARERAVVSEQESLQRSRGIKG